MSLGLQLLIQEHYHGGNWNEVVKGMKIKCTFSLIGDNFNVKVGVKHGRNQRHGTMHIWFASAAIVQTNHMTICQVLHRGIHKICP
jgi:hypothetical protein